MTVKRLLYGYLVFLHLAALGVAAYFYDHLGPAFFAIELGLLISLAMLVAMIRRLIAPLATIQSFTDVLNEREYSTRFSPVGVAELDRLISLYNQMLGELYDQRVRIGEKEGFVERFLAASPVGVLMFDFDGHVVLANPAAQRMLESPSKLDGKRLGQISGQLAAGLQTVSAGDHAVLWGTGQRRYRVEHSVYVDRGFDRHFYVIEELTELLNESERKAYEKLIRMMSHEVNNTVAATNSLLESCRSYTPQLREEDREDFDHALQVVIRRSERLNRFMKKFASVVKLPQPHLERVCLGDLVSTMTTMFTAQAAEHAIQWRVMPSSPPARVLADVDQIEQVLINIIKNALESIDKRGSITIDIQTDQNSAMLRVTDTGTGIPDAMADHLFSPFASSKPDGQGLGLTLVREILSRHQWSFDLQNRSDGETGAVFWMRAPLAE